jgi:hypothetical protein
LNFAGVWWRLCSQPTLRVAVVAKQRPELGQFEERLALVGLRHRQPDHMRGQVSPQPMTNGDFQPEVVLMARLLPQLEKLFAMLVPVTVPPEQTASRVKHQDGNTAGMRNPAPPISISSFIPAPFPFAAVIDLRSHSNPYVP